MAESLQDYYLGQAKVAWDGFLKNLGFDNGAPSLPSIGSNSSSPGLWSDPADLWANITGQTLTKNQIHKLAPVDPRTGKTDADAEALMQRFVDENWPNRDPLQTIYDVARGNPLGTDRTADNSRTAWDWKLYALLGVAGLAALMIAKGKR
jgi:hypothetical protein